MKNFVAISTLFTLFTAILGAPRTGIAPATAQGAKTQKAPALAPLKRRPGFIVGRCVDGRGKPLRGVRIRVFGTTAAGEKTNYQTTTGTNGQYSIQLPKGNFHVGWAHFDAPSPAGPPYALPLHPIDGNIDDAPSAQGIVENFVLKIAGRISPLNDAGSDLSYYGGSIQLSRGTLANGSMFTGYTYEFPEGASVELQLTPVGKLVDGSVGKTLTRRQSVRYGATFLDIPIGQYQVAATLIEADGTRKPLRVAVARVGVGTMPIRFTPKPEEFGASGTLYFPSTGDSTPLLKLPGVSQAEVYVQP
ncbi:MAG: carboxypeptidase-like regulatory domain-containing protein [Armatimonadetes bacterium]|nr:carboxypeptidase-like regulatory domain-containing protein [Armatimonadota bacterium]